MLLRTHLVITLFFVLLLLSFIHSKIIFVSISLIATLLPDADSKFSSIGKKKVFRILQFFVKHRGLTHSFIFLILITLFFVLFFPVFALPLFLGGSLHLLADSFTVKGICPFYPWGKKISGRIITGKRAETGIFAFFLFWDLILVFLNLFSIL